MRKQWCDHRHRLYHTKETCWKLHGKPANWKPCSQKDSNAPYMQLDRHWNLKSLRLTFRPNKLQQLLNQTTLSKGRISHFLHPLLLQFLSEVITAHLFCLILLRRIIGLVDTNASGQMPFASYETCADGMNISVVDGSVSQAVPLHWPLNKVFLITQISA